MGIASRKRTRQARAASSGLATATAAAYLACQSRTAQAFVPRPTITFGGSSRSSRHLDGIVAALRMVASRPRIGEDILIGSSTELNRPPRRTSNAAAKANSNRRRAPSNRNNADKKQQHHKQRSHLPLPPDENHVSYALHEEMAPILRRFDDVSHQLANMGSAAAAAAAARVESSGGEAAITQTAMAILSRAVDVLDAHMTMAIDDESSNLDFAASEQEERTLRTEWLVHYASRVVRSYLQIERHLDLDLAPDNQGMIGGDANDPLYQADALLRRLESSCAASSNDSSQQQILLPWIDTAGSVLSTSYLRERIYNHVIGAYTKRAKIAGGRRDGDASTSSRAREYVETAESILERMAQHGGGGGGLVGPDAKSYGLVLAAHARCADGAEAAAALLRRMEMRHEEAEMRSQKAHELRPNVICYNAVLNAYARAGRPTDAMDLLERMESRGMEADVVSYTSVLDGYARWLESSAATSQKNLSVTESDVLRAIEKAEEVMIKLERSKDGPNVVSYNALLKVYLNAAKILGKIKSESESSSSQLVDLAASASSTFDRMTTSKVYPNFVTYSCAIHVGAAVADSIALRSHKKARRSDAAWQSHAFDAASLSYDILNTMEDAYVGNNDARLCPPVKLYNMVITALGRCNTEAGISAAHDLIQHMENNGSLHVTSRPNTVTYTAYMKALADMCCPSAARRAEEVLITMESLYRKGNAAVKPTLMSYNTSLRAWAKVQNRNGAERADRVLSQMEAKSNAGVSTVRPDLYSYSICIDAWAKSRDGRAGERAENIFERMQSKPSCLRPNLVVYNALINAWGASRDNRAGDKAMAVLAEMEETSGVRPDRFSYSSVIDALAKSGTENAAVLAEDALAKMENIGGYCSPSIITYNCVLNVVASSTDGDSGARAEAILDRMETADVVSYNTVIKAWANDICDDKAEKAHDILTQMTEDPDKPNPDIFTYNSVLNACASSTADHVGAFHIAVETFQMLKQSTRTKPNKYTYGTLLKACATLLPIGEERRALTAQIFSECERNGCLSDPVLRMLRSSLSEEEFVHIVGGQKLGE